MMRLVDADKLKENIIKNAKYTNWLVRAIAETPTVEPKRGRWITDGVLPTACSECGHIWEGFRFRGGNYCPNCGAKMDKE